MAVFVWRRLDVVTRRALFLCTKRSGFREGGVVEDEGLRYCDKGYFASIYMATARQPTTIYMQRAVHMSLGFELWVRDIYQSNSGGSGRACSLSEAEFLKGSLPDHAPCSD